MSPSVLRGTRAALCDVCEDLRPLVAAAARRHARVRPEFNFHGGVEEIEADAWLILLEAYHSHDPAKSEFAQRAAFVVPARLKDRARVWARRNAKLTQQPIDPDTREAPTEPAPVPWGELSRKCSPDGRALLALLMESPPDLDDAIRADPEPGPESIRRLMKEYAASVWGWLPARVRAAFDDVKTAF